MRSGILLCFVASLASAGVCDFTNEERTCEACVLKASNCFFCGDGTCKLERVVARSSEKCCDPTRGKPCFKASGVDSCPSLRNTTRKVGSGLACIATRSYGTVAAPPAGSMATITALQETGEYGTVTNVVAGSLYTALSSQATDYITVTNTQNAPIAEGITPVPFVAPSSATYRFHYFLSSACDGGAGGPYRTSQVANTITCTATYPYGFASAPSVYLQEQIIASDQEPGEYASVSGCLAGSPYQAKTSVQTDYITVKGPAPSEAVVGAGIQPVTFTPTVSGTYTIHYHLDATCRTTPSSYRTSSIVNFRPTCTATVGYGSVQAPQGGRSAEITQRQETGEYATVVGAGGNAIFAARSSVSTDYITVRSGSPTGAVIHAGPQPVLFVTSQTPATYYLHYHLSAACNSNSGVYRTSSVENTRKECFGVQEYGHIVAPIASTTIITNKQKTGDWAVVTDVVAFQEYLVSSDNPTDHITVTAQSVGGQVIAAGVTPLAWAIEEGGTAYLHFYNGDGCGNDGATRTTSVANTPAACEGSYRWPTGPVPLPTNGATRIISTDNFYSDYAELQGSVAGARYSIATTLPTYVTIRTGSNTGAYLAAGNQPVQFATIAGTSSYYVSFHQDSSCSTGNWDAFGSSVTHVSGIEEK